MLKTGLVDRLQKAAGGLMDEVEVLQWRVNQAHAEQMGDLELIPLSDQQSGQSWSVLSLFMVHECALSKECCYVHVLLMCAVLFPLSSVCD